MVLDNKDIRNLNQALPLPVKLGTLLAALEAGTGITDKGITLEKLEDGTAGYLIVVGADGVPAYVALSGDALISAAGLLSLADDVVGVDQSKFVQRDITIAAEAASGTVTNAADIGGMLIGWIPKTSVDSAVQSIAFDNATGQLTATLKAAQAAGTPATITATILQA